MDFDDGSTAYDPAYHDTTTAPRAIPEFGEAVASFVGRLAGDQPAQPAPAIELPAPVSVGTVRTLHDAPRVSSIRAAADKLAEFIHDPAYIAGMRAALIEAGIYDYLGIQKTAQKRECAPPLLPASADITAIQTALWDNWPGGTYRSGSPNRYGMAVEIWTCPPGEVITEKPHLNPSSKFNLGLMNYKSLKNQIKVLRKPRANRHSQPSGEYLDDLAALAEKIKGTQNLVGLVNTNIGDDHGEYHRGVYYHPYQFILVEMDADRLVEAKLVLSMGDVESDIIVLAPFVAEDVNGAALPARIIGQSRHDIGGLDDPSWATNR